MCVQIRPMQADAGIVTESTLLSEITESEIEYNYDCVVRGWTIK
jgi:hypothetical protein